MIIMGSFSPVLHKNMWVLAEALLMCIPNICCNGEIRKIIPELSPNTPP